MEKIKIGGVRLIRKLLQVNLFGKASEVLLISEVCREMARRAINIAFLSGRPAQGNTARASFCVEADKERQVGESLDFITAPIEKTEFLSPVAMITFHPRGDGLELLGAVLELWGENGLPLHGLSTSLSAISCTTDDARVEDVLSAIEDYLILPPNHAPLLPEIKVVQSLLKKEG
jgi:hypothetical protein